MRLVTLPRPSTAIPAALAALCAVLVLPAEQPAGPAVPPLRAPLDGPPVRAFDLPGGPFGPGHRGVDLAGPAGAVVHAPAPGRVTFAGPVAGVSWVSIEVAPGVVVSLGPLTRLGVRAGDLVGTLAPLGRLRAGHGGALHLGLRVGGAYVDPLPHLARLGPPRLAPLHAPGGRAPPVRTAQPWPGVGRGAPRP